MASKIKVYSPKIHRKGTTEEGVDIEYEEIVDPFSMKSPKGPNSIVQDMEKPSEAQTFRMTKRNNTIMSKQPEFEEFFDENEVEALFKELGNHKKSSLLKNFTFEGLRDSEIREDYFILLCFICLYGGEDFHLEGFKTKSQALNSLNYLGEKPNQILRRKDFVSKVLVAAANQSEDIMIKEIIKNDSLGYIVSIAVVVAFLKANQHQYLKSLLKVVEPNKFPLFHLGTLTSLIPDNLNAKTALTSNNMPKRGKAMKGMDFVDDGSDKKKKKTRLEHGMTLREVAGTVAQMTATLRRPTIIDREFLPKSAYDNVIIEARFDTVFPHLIQMNRMDLVEPLLDYFGEKHINHLNLFIGFGQEELAMNHYKKFSWELTEGQIIMLLERKMWRFLCNISDDAQKMLFFTDQTFTAVSEMLQDGKILSEMILLFMTLPTRGWRQNQTVMLMELAKNLIYEDPDSSRLIYANNPILTCAQLSYLLKQLCERFRFLQNELEVLSEKLERVSEHLQSESRENNLYALYLTTLPTGLTMLDYIIRMGMKGLVETKFTKALVLEFWNDEFSVTGSRKQISYLNHGAKVAKRFGWRIDLKPHMEYNYAFQFGNTMNSPKYLLLMDVFYLLFFYFVFDSYCYNKLNLFELTDRDPSFTNTFDPYFIDFGYSFYGVTTILQILVMINYLIYFIYRCIHISTLSIGKVAYKGGYIVTTIALTVTLLTLLIFPSYQSQNDNQIFIKSILVVTRTGIIYLTLVSMLGFQKSGQLITILSTVIVSLVPILILLNVYILFYSEILYNFFYDYQLFNSAIESFFSLVEVLFGSLTFADVGNVNDSVGEYYGINANLTYFAFSSNILATFLIIAYLSSILERVRQDASYQNTLSQYYFLQMFSSTKFKGFYTFPPLISAATIPFLLFSNIRQLTERINMFLLKVRFYLVWVPYQLFKYVIQAVFYYCPILYFRSIVLICMNKMHFDGIRIFHLILWIFISPIVMAGYAIIDMIILLKVLNRNFEISMPEHKILQRSTDDNVIYIHRYGSLKDAINEFTRKYTDHENIPYNALLNWLMSGGKEMKDPQKYMSLRTTRKAREILAELVREHLKRTSGSKWLKNIHAAKKKLFREILDGFLSYKAVNMRSEDATIEPKLVLDLLSKVDDENVNYLRARHVSSIQMVLLNAQSKEQISIINKIEELDKKVEVLSKLWSNQLPKMNKLPSIFQTSQTPTLLKNLNSLT